MINKILRAILLLLVASLAIACGTLATPVYEAPEEEPTVVEAANADDSEAVAVVPTETPEPPTATPTEEPTVTPEPPTATPTEEPTEAVAEDPIARLIAMRDPADGEALFNQMFAETGFACETCHFVDQEGTKIGPSLVNIANVASTRVEGMGAERYLYNSIVHPNEYLVEGYVADLMPQTWGDVLSDTQIYDIIAYLLTLDG